jgi:hypothetical protein
MVAALMATMMVISAAPASAAGADDRVRELEERYEDYTVYDLDDLFVDETDREEYLGVRMGL